MINTILLWTFQKPPTELKENTENYTMYNVIGTESFSTVMHMRFNSLQTQAH